MKVILTVALVWLAAVVPQRLAAQLVLMKGPADSAVMVGIDQIYSYKFDEASETFQWVQRQYPDHPVGYFLDAMVDWWRIQANNFRKDLDDSFLKKIDRVVSVCDTILEKNKGDIKGLFFKGGALGYRGRFHAMRKEWVSAAGDGKEALNIVIKSWELAPGNHDVLLGIGIYHYFAEAIPEEYPLVKPLMYFLPPGDKRSGILELEQAALKARYSAVEAKVVLMQIYYSFEKAPGNTEKCYAIAKELVERYPTNPYFLKYYARCMVRMGMLDQVELVWRDVLIRSMDKKTGFDYAVAREAMYYIGYSLARKKEYDMAAKYFAKCDEFSEKLDVDEVSGFRIQAVLRMGNVYKDMGRKDLAWKAYERVLDWPDNAGSHAQAKEALAALKAKK